MRKNARVTEVKADIDSLGDALEAFKAKYGEYPPSRITLHSTPAGWDSDPRSKAIIRKFWPRFRFTLARDSMGNPKPGSADGANGDFASAWPNSSTSLHMDGAECLVFFLDGVRDGDGSYVGFSTNETQPFSLAPDDSRVGPFFRFPADRLVDADGDQVLEYVDPLPDSATPYIYLSSYNGRGYNLNDLDADGDLMDQSDRRMTAIYTDGGGKAFKPKSYQIISPGFDGDYGQGGQYDPDNAGGVLTGARDAERDNITNFHGGLLGD